MKVKNNAVPLKLAKRMAKLGWYYETEHTWNSNTGKWKLLVKGPVINWEWWFAPNATEIAERLPIEIYISKKVYSKEVYDKDEIYWHMHYRSRKLPQGVNFCADTLVELLGEMWCYLREKKLI